jgi:hypothetical protein
MEEPLPRPTHGKLRVRSVAVEEERLAEDRQVPVGEEEQCDDHVVSGLRVRVA